MKDAFAEGDMIEQQLPGDLENVKVPDILPVLSLYNTVVFPHMTFPMEVDRRTCDKSCR